jgi:hypothetical protein
MPSRTIGLTFFLRAKDQSIWNNGAEQNCAFLWMLLRAAGYRALAVNGGDGEVPSPLLSKLGIEFVRFADVASEVDLLIEGGAQVSAEHVASVRARGGRAVAYKFGNAFVIDSERAIHAKASGSIFNGSCFDAVWTTPQHMRTCASYWETCYRAPVRVVPHIWEPTFVDAAVAEMPEGMTFGYQPGTDKRRISVFEPNINIVKTCVVPMLAIEQAYRRTPALVGDVYITNAIELKEHEFFRSFAGNLDIVRAGLTSFEARYNTPFFLAKFTDVVVSHQWENALNYAYYDALYGGYPLVHNSDMLPDGVGYRYSGFDAADAGTLLSAVLATHDANAAAYRARADAFLTTVRATAPGNVAAYARAVERLFQERGLHGHEG